MLCLPRPGDATGVERARNAIHPPPEGLVSRGDPTVLVTRPISLGLLLAAVALLLLIALPNIRKKREQVFEEGET